MKIRKAKEKDLRSIYRLINKNNREAYSKIIPEDVFKDPILPMEELEEFFKELNFYVYEENGEILGVAGLKTGSGKAGKIRWVHVSPDHRREGIGKRLIEKIEAEAEKRGLEKLRIKYVHSNAEWAKAFYSSLGYEKIGKKSHPQGEFLDYEKKI